LGIDRQPAKQWTVWKKTNKMKQWYEQMFEDYGEKYDQETFTHGTKGECDFIEEEISFDKSIRILDIGCGTGRHSIELTRRGYNVTGIDLSERQLEIARKKATGENLNISFRRMDARNLQFNGEFDLAIMLCEGSFPLMETDEMNYMILQSAFRALDSKGKFIFTTLNGLFPLFNSAMDFCNEASGEDNARTESSRFDLMTFRDYNVTSIIDEDGKKIEYRCNERYYVPPEITWLLSSAGFKDTAIYGARLGAFSRNERLTTKDFEMLVITRKY
jgi:2-polyprenyl-3-methyl-5-hydroxy-6-metoxy-1,4-benzoquinol methylase